ncbi:chromate transporter, partial [Turicibacter sanguinis]|nr:chromate transporter [Turicibacter sanguinis]
FCLSAFTFGGGYVIVPLMRKKFVNELEWLDEKEMLDLTAIAQSAPGAMAVNAAILVGYRLAGILGAFITILATVLPPLIILSVISMFYQLFRESILVGALMFGMQAAIGAVIVDVVFGMANNLVKDSGKKMIWMMLIVFILSYIFNVNLILIIITCALIGAFSVHKHRETKGDEVTE